MRQWMQPLVEQERGAMESREGDRRGCLCACVEQRPVKYFCERCQRYLCQDCMVCQHVDHDAEVCDLNARCLQYLSAYQKLAHATNLLATRRQAHIHDLPADCIMEAMRGQILAAQETLLSHIKDYISTTITAVGNSPLLLEVARRKQECASQSTEGLHSLQADLNATCKSLLQAISSGEYLGVSNLTKEEKLQEFESLCKANAAAFSKDLELIRQINGLKSSCMVCSFDPSAIAGMLHFESKLEKPRRLVQFDRSSGTVLVYMLQTRLLHATHLASGFVLPYRFMTVEAAGDIYITGGDNGSGRFSRSLIRYDELAGCLTLLTAMQSARSRHASASLATPWRVLVFGGENEEGVLSACESYDLKLGRWSSIPPLNVRRCSHSACRHSNTLYVVGGWHKHPLRSIERLEPEHAWEIVEIVGTLQLKPLQSPGLASIGEHSVVIYGGFGADEQFVDDCLELDLQRCCFLPLSPLRASDTFVASEANHLDNCLFSFGYSRGGIHVFDLLDKSWTFTPHHLLVTPP